MTDTHAVWSATFSNLHPRWFGKRVAYWKSGEHRFGAASSRRYVTKFGFRTQLLSVVRVLDYWNSFIRGSRQHQLWPPQGR